MDGITICEEPHILSVLLIMKYALQIVFTLVPIILIILVIVDLFKIVMNPKKENVSGSISMIGKRTVAAIIVFLIPVIINYVFTSIITNSENPLKVCANNISLERIKELTELQKQKLEAEKEKERQKMQEALEKRKEKEDSVNEVIQGNREENNSEEVEGGDTTFGQVAEPELIVNNEFKVTKQRLALANYTSFNKASISLVDNRGNALNPNDYNFESSNKGIVTVTKDGVIKPHFGGITNIIITSKDDPSKKASVNVTVVQTIYTNVKVLSKVTGNSLITGNSVTLNAGTQGVYNGVAKSSIKGYPYGDTIKVGNDYIQINNNSVTPVSYAISSMYGKEYVEDFVNSNGFDSKTKYLFWTSHGSQTEYMFTGSKGNWRLYKVFPVNTGDFLHNGDNAGTKVHINSYTVGRRVNEGLGVDVIYKNNGGGGRGSNPFHVGGGNGSPSTHGCTAFNAEDMKYLVSVYSDIVDSRIIDF